MASSPVTIAQLPNEIISYILDFLDTPSDFEHLQYEDPALIPEPKSSDSSRGDLKSASLVCRLWRRCTLPLLFRNVIWRFQHINRPPPGQDPLSTVEGLDFLRFLVHSGLDQCVQSLTIIIDYPTSAIGDDLSHYNNWGVLPSHVPFPILTERDDDVTIEPGSNPRPKGQSNNWLWETIFDHLDLLSINLVSSPAILASLLGRPMDLSGCWIFRQRFHILSLSRPAKSIQKLAAPPATSTPPASTGPRPRIKTSVPCNLFSIRPWESMLLNEGSSVKVYTTYEYFNHVPPSLLHALLDTGDESMQYFLQNTLRSFSYIAIFPLATHINHDLIHRIPALESFYIQIVPRAPSFAGDDYRHPAMDISDLWMERNTAYASLIMAIFDPPPLGSWSSLQYFESGDAIDREAWEQAVRYVIFAAGATWKVAGEGKFVRRRDKVPMAIHSAAMV
ncbi:hypothetical protein BBK36DRAFT_1138726 [Trichoderma citrinoviride]|uniref:Uncharacterized protein n=1 Tax=Trichoderma citrinoviride TaxID=58853 RepID=A0A2T4BH27_9HYPO|nr:hypothetical protein BBK36DRAFT_1138726 [Trichoderma citrinoviride]PTB68623.1 hypothetical protein BBK36DRAFT_1138726 [Trichoderma citrinoviride]